jgi:predicted dienelactone hydrolase
MSVPFAKFAQLAQLTVLLLLGQGYGFVAGIQTAAAAERLTISYGLLERSVSLEALGDYAQSGQLDDNLYVYTRYVKPEQRETLRRSLNLKSDFSAVAISQFLYSPQGQILLERLGQVIQPESRDNGLYAIRSALILAASDPVGLTPLNVFRHFPTRGIRIDLQKSLAIADDLNKIVSETKQLSALITQQADQATGTTTAPNPADFSANTSRLGPVRWSKQQINFEDRRRITLSGFSRLRNIALDLYTPNIRKNSQYPAIVISHGLGSDQASFAYLAEHLASHGYVVVVPSHPGSDARQMSALLSGTAQEVASPSEFVDRPLDIKFILDRLSQDRRFSYVNWQQVGMVGQSFGGYTAFALGGAPLNFPTLAESCGTNQQLNTFDLSLLLQCRANALPRQNYNLQDPRIKAILAINPVTSQVFGQAGMAKIQVPTMIIAGKADTVAPAVPEQIRPFTWLTTPDRYLVLVDRSTHFSFLAESSSSTGVQIGLPPEVVGPNLSLNRSYLKALSLPFFRTHLQQISSFRPYLSAAYGRSISRAPLQIDLVQTLNIPD